jgi:hypothetical protein
VVVSAVAGSAAAWAAAGSAAVLAAAGSVEDAQDAPTDLKCFTCWPPLSGQPLKTCKMMSKALPHVLSVTGRPLPTRAY